MDIELLKIVIDRVGLNNLVENKCSVKLLETLDVRYEGCMLRFYNEKGQTHSFNDLPAVIYPSGTKVWCKNGEYHRDNDLPAAIFIDGEKHWYKNGKEHRDGDKPAVIYADGTKVWYKNGIRTK